MLKSENVLIIYIFITAETYISVTLDLVTKYGDLAARGMVIESKGRLATNNIFTNVVVSLVTTECQFSQLRLRHFIFATKICHNGHPSFTGRLTVLLFVQSYLAQIFFFKKFVACGMVWLLTCLIVVVCNFWSNELWHFKLFVNKV